MSEASNYRRHDRRRSGKSRSVSECGDEHLTGKPADETEPRKAIEKDLPPFYDYLNSQLGDPEYFVGNSMSIADISVACLFVNTRLAGENPDAKRWPKLHAFLKRMQARPSLQAIIQPILPLLGQRWKEFA